KKETGAVKHRQERTGLRPSGREWVDREGGVEDHGVGFAEQEPRLQTVPPGTAPGEGFNAAAATRVAPPAVGLLQPVPGLVAMAEPVVRHRHYGIIQWRGHPAGSEMDRPRRGLDRPLGLSGGTTFVRISWAQSNERLPVQ